MIHVKFLGHIRTSLGTDGMEVPGAGGMSIGDMFSLILSFEPKTGSRHGFSEYNTLVVVNDEEVFSASTRHTRLLNDGDSVLLVPFSHGG